MGASPRMTSWAETLGTALRLLGTVLPGLLGWALLSYGAWLAWPPAGFMVAGGLLLVDQAWTRVRAGRSQR